MRTMLWIAASGVLLASGSAYAHAEQSKSDDVTVHADRSADAPPAAVDVTVSHPDPRGSACDTSRMQSTRTSPREKPEARSAAVTVDLDHPGGEFPSGG